MAADGIATRRGLLALTAGGVLLAGCGDDEPAGARGPSDESQAATLNSALAFEHAVIAAYRTGQPFTRGRARAALHEIAVQETAFADRLATLVRRYGGEPARPRTLAEYQRSFPRMAGQRDVLTFAGDLERRSVRKYLEALPRLAAPELRGPLAEIAVAQGRHLALVRGLSGDPQAPDAFVTGVE